MNLTSHIALTAPIAAVIAWKSGIAPAACFYGGAVLIDIDHFIFYMRRTGRCDPVEMFSWFEYNERRCSATDYHGLNIFHAAEFFGLIAIAAIFFPILAWLLPGMAYHLVLDYLWIYRHPKLNIRVRALSWTEHFVRRSRGEREYWRGSERQGCRHAPEEQHHEPKNDHTAG